MKVLFDMNVILDVLIERAPHFRHSVSCIAAIENGRADGWVCSTTITTLAYLLQKELSVQTANKHIESLLSLFQVSIVNKQVLLDALTNGFSDYEDSVLYQSAIVSNLDCIISRNKKDFKKSNLPVFTPKEFIATLSR